MGHVPLPVSNLPTQCAVTWEVTRPGAMGGCVRHECVRYVRGVVCVRHLLKTPWSSLHHSCDWRLSVLLPHNSQKRMVAVRDAMKMMPVLKTVPPTLPGLWPHR